MNLDLEKAFINKYVVKSKRQRYLGFIEKPKTRGIFLGMLYHGQDLDESKFVQLKGNVDETRKSVLTQVVKVKSSANCYIVSVDSGIDGLELPTEKAVESLLGRDGTVIIFGEGQAVYYCGEPPHNEYLSC